MMTQPTLVNVSPAGCVPPHGITHPDKLDELTTALTLTSWDGPALVGYRVWLGGRIQLLSGSHRWEAVRASNLAIPVVVWDRESVEEAYGDLERWGVIMRSGDGYAR